MRALKAILSLLLIGPTLATAEFSLETQQLTAGPQHHFFGYIGHVQNIPWNRSGRFILALRSSFQDHLPRPDEAAEIVLLDTRQNRAVQVVDKTRAWNPQQGTMLYWNPDAAETQFFFNDRDLDTGKIFCVLYDIKSRKRVREFRFEDTPVGNSGVGQQGKWFAAINYGRLAKLRPVTGYPEAFDWTDGIDHPEDDGVFKINSRTGEKQLLVSFKQMAELMRPRRPNIDGKALFVNHTLCDRENNQIFFFARADFDKPNRINQAFVMNSDGSGLKLLKQHIGGHPEWDLGHRMIGSVNNRQVIYDVHQQKIVGEIGDPTILPSAEGDIALSPDGRWLVNGHRQNSTNYYTFFRRADGAWVRSPGFPVRGWESGDLRCDPAPCWNRDSNEIVFPAIAGDGTRQMFSLRLKKKK
jgi:hypothetical protein